MTDFPPILDVRAASSLLMLSDRTIREMAANGEIPANRTPGGKWRFSRDALIRWAEGTAAHV